MEVIAAPFCAEARFGAARFGSDDAWRLVGAGNHFDGACGDADGVSRTHKYAAQDADTSGIDQQLHVDEYGEGVPDE